jgi:hypothetical protein
LKKFNLKGKNILRLQLEGNNFLNIWLERKFERELERKGCCKAST